MSKKKTITVVPANRSPDTINSVMTVVRIIPGGISGESVETCHLHGIVEEKLAQYKEFFGEEWNGFGERTIVTCEEDKTEFVPLFGDYVHTRMGNPATIKAQETIAAMVEEAKQTLRDNEEMKKTWPARKEAKERKVTRKELVEAIAERTLDEDQDTWQAEEDENRRRFE